VKRFLASGFALLLLSLSLSLIHPSIIQMFLSLIQVSSISLSLSYTSKYHPNVSLSHPGIIHLSLSLSLFAHLVLSESARGSAGGEGSTRGGGRIRRRRRGEGAFACSSKRFWS